MTVDTVFGRMPHHFEAVKLDSLHTVFENMMLQSACLAAVCLTLIVLILVVYISFNTRGGKIIDGSMRSMPSESAPDPEIPNRPPMSIFKKENPDEKTP